MCFKATEKLNQTPKLIFTQRSTDCLKTPFSSPVNNNVRLFLKED